MNAHDYAELAHDACVRAKDAAWAMRKACKHDNPEAWRDLCEAIAEAADATGKCMDLTRPAWAPEPPDAEEAREAVRMVQHANY